MDFTGGKTGFIPRLRTLYDSDLSFNGVVGLSPNRLSPFDTGGVQQVPGASLRAVTVRKKKL